MSAVDTLITPRGTGKTEALANICLENEWTLVCHSRLEANRVRTTYGCYTTTMSDLDGGETGDTDDAYLWDHKAVHEQLTKARSSDSYSGYTPGRATFDEGAAFRAGRSGRVPPISQEQVDQARASLMGRMPSPVGDPLPSALRAMERDTVRPAMRVHSNPEGHREWMRGTWAPIDPSHE